MASNFQLFRSVTVKGAYRSRRLPPFRTEVIEGYHFDMRGQPRLHAIQAAFVHLNVTNPHGALVFGLPARAVPITVPIVDHANG